MKDLTLDKEFPFPTLGKPRFKSAHEIDLAKSYQFVTILRYIIENEARLEHKEHIDSDNWKPGTLREFLRYATGLPKGEDPKRTPFQDYLRWWRIKRTPTQSELQRIITIHDKEEE